MLTYGWSICVNGQVRDYIILLYYIFTIFRVKKNCLHFDFGLLGWLGNGKYFHNEWDDWIVSLSVLSFLYRYLLYEPVLNAVLLRTQEIGYNTVHTCWSVLSKKSPMHLAA